ncbi:hypothetical protein [Clostridium tarantellae]|uniref:Uncharacterized protein n=1 Tax=Clostridium tarantellae TaxID=39493 RepID=A0A6I1MKX1_9CLOT|nr:hypothetical protein [Clostridium tarantellae]MPQ43383.1 hypothetical protein [Clostridium tarantellae]
MRFLKNKKILIPLLVIAYISIVLANNICNKLAKAHRESLGNERYTYMKEYKYDVNNFKLYYVKKDDLDSSIKFEGKINEELNKLNKYKKAMSIFSNYYFRNERDINEYFLNIEAQERMLNKVTNLQELETQINNCIDLNRSSMELVASDSFLNKAILEEDWRLAEEILFKNLIGKKYLECIRYEKNDLGESIPVKYKSSKNYYNNVYQNAIKLNDELELELSLDLRINKNDDSNLLEKCKAYKQYYLDTNCGLKIEEDNCIDQITGIVKLANEKKSLLDDVHKHMLEQIEKTLK